MYPYSLSVPIVRSLRLSWHALFRYYLRVDYSTVKTHRHACMGTVRYAVYDISSMESRANHDQLITVTIHSVCLSHQMPFDSYWKTTADPSYANPFCQGFGSSFLKQYRRKQLYEIGMTSMILRLTAGSISYKRESECRLRRSLPAGCDFPYTCG